MESALTKPFGIYIHVPFCIHKCSYCDFYSFTEFNDELKKKYEEALHREIKQASLIRSSDPSPVTSIFFGGGTPSLMPVEFYKRIFESLKKSFRWSDSIEITMEANPETITQEYLIELKTTPINRISLGAQSFQKKYLDALERLGNRQSIETASRLLIEEGFSNFNLDLIFAIADQSVEESLNDLNAATRLSPKHLSFYQLTLKPGHKLFSKLPEQDKGAEFFAEAKSFLMQKGFVPYEISNFSVPGYECQHNLLYWEGNDYLGLGPSASSRFFWNGLFHHRKQVADIKKYIAQESFDEIPFETTTKAQTQLEALFLELRKNKGISLQMFESRYQLNPAKSKHFSMLKKHGFLENDEKTLRLTEKGLLVEESVILKLVEDSR